MYIKKKEYAFIWITRCSHKEVFFKIASLNVWLKYLKNLYLSFFWVQLAKNELLRKWCPRILKMGLCMQFFFKKKYIVLFVLVWNWRNKFQLSAKIIVEYGNLILYSLKTILFRFELFKQPLFFFFFFFALGFSSSCVSRLPILVVDAIFYQIL